MTGDPDSSFRRRQYRDPPVIEAVCRFHFSEPLAWNITTPGLLYERVRETYNEEPQGQQLMQASFGSSAGAAGIEVRGAAEQMRFSREEGTRLLVVSAQDVFAHGLPPYEGWESLEERLLDGVSAVEKLFGTLPKIDLVGLRYINRIELPDTARFEEYLTITMAFPQGFPDAIASFFERTELRYNDAPIMMAFTWATVQSPPGTIGLVLDLDFYWRNADDQLTVKQAREVLGDLKLREGRAFESLLQDRLREVFGEI